MQSTTKAKADLEQAINSQEISIEIHASASVNPRDLNRIYNSLNGAWFEPDDPSSSQALRSINAQIANRLTDRLREIETQNKALEQKKQEEQGELNRKIATQFETFKKAISEGALYQDKENGDWLEDGDFLVANSINTYPKYVEEHIAEALIALAEKKADGTFFLLIKVFLRKNNNIVLLKEFIEHQNASFIQICGPFLLCAAIKISALDLCQYLINEKHVNVNYVMNNLQSSLHFAVYHYNPYWKDETSARKEKNELIALLVEKNANVNHRSIYGQIPLMGLLYSNFNAPSIALLLEAGSSPFYFHELYNNNAININRNILSQALIRINDSTSIGLLCEYGAGLIIKEARLSTEAYDNAQIKQNLLQLAKELSNDPEQNNLFVNRFLNSEIAFKINENGRLRWIFDLKEFSEVLKANLELSSDKTLKETLCILCKNVLEASSRIMAYNVREVVHNIVVAKFDIYSTTLLQLSEIFSSPLSQLVLSYSRSNSKAENSLLETYEKLKNGSSQRKKFGNRAV